MSSDFRVPGQIRKAGQAKTEDACRREREIIKRSETGGSFVEKSADAVSPYNDLISDFQFLISDFLHASFSSQYRMD